MRIITLDIDASFHNADRLLARLAAEHRVYYDELASTPNHVIYVANVTDAELKRLRVLCADEPSRLSDAWGHDEI